MVTLTEKHYPNRLSLYKTYGLHPLMLNGGLGMVRNKALMKLGRIFESLVGEVLAELFTEVQPHPHIDNCIPDFVVGETWYDAKLSRSTVFSPGCETIDKYRKHTDYLVIIYALHDTDSSDDRAKFVHINELRPLVTPRIQRKIDAFIRKATEVRFGESNRLSDV